MGFYLFFSILMVVCIGTVIFSLTEKHKNVGYIFTSILIVILNIFCLYIIAADTLEEARRALIPYYLVYPWLFFGTLLTVIRSHTPRLHLDCNIGMAVICSIQSGIILSCFFKNGLITFTQNVLYGRIWWVAKMPMLQYDPDAYVAFHALCLINCIIIFLVMLVFVLNVPKVFKVKYINLMILQGVMFVLILFTFIYNYPVWIHTVVMNFVCYLTYYYIFVYSNLKLRESVLYDFANELSDGVIIYNMYNDVIHINDRFKKIVSEDIIKGIQSIEMTERWISRSDKIGDFTVLPYSYNDKDYFFKTDKKIIGSENDTIGTVYIFHDMSAEIEQMKLMKKMNTDLERNSLIRSDYLTFVTNRLLVPINQIVKLTDGLASDNKISPELSESIRQINKSGVSLKNIVNEMHDHSMLDNDSFEIKPEGYDPLAEIYDVCNNIQGSLGNDATDFMFIIDPELPHELIGDKFRIRQVVVNLSEIMIKLIGPGIVRIVLSCRPISEDDICLEFHLIGMGLNIKNFEPEKNDDPRFTISQKLITSMDGSFDMNRINENEMDFRFSLPQKVSDHTKDLVVENSSRKFAFCLNEKNVLNEEFKKEMKAIGMDGKVISSLSDYKATGKTDYLFFISEYYNETTSKFLDEHPMVIGIMLIGDDMDSVPVKPNLRYIRKPISTLSMVLALNGMEFKNLGKQKE